jgi:acetyl esterase/lipase
MARQRDTIGVCQSMCHAMKPCSVHTLLHSMFLRRCCLIAIMALGCSASSNGTAGSGSPAGADHAQIFLWPGEAPGGEHVSVREQITERSQNPKIQKDRIIKGVRHPSLIVFRPARANGTAMLMAPGGGYAWVVMDKEGYEAAERFADTGVTVFVLAYRLPGDGWAAGADTSLQDAQRALRMIRANAAEYAIKPDRIGVIGFSAGGHVAGMLALKFDQPVYARIDAIDTVSARPDFSILMYPVATMATPFAHAGSRRLELGENPSDEQVAAYSLERNVRADAPPLMLVHALDDRSVPVENSLQLLAAYRALKVPVEVHLFEEGGHGFGLRFAIGKPVAAWPDLVLRWMQQKGY